MDDAVQRMEIRRQVAVVLFRFEDQLCEPLDGMRRVGLKIFGDGGDDLL